MVSGDPSERIQVGPNSWMTRRAYEKKPDRRIEKYLSIQISPSATPSKRSSAPPKRPDNNWEKGIVTEDRRSGSMPVVDANLNPIGVKDLPQKRRAIEETRRRNRQTQTDKER